MYSNLNKNFIGKGSKKVLSKSLIFWKTFVEKKKKLSLFLEFD